MKNLEKNKQKWLIKVQDTLELSGKSKLTFCNYRSHIQRFLYSFNEEIEINKLTEEQIADYLKKNYINLNKGDSTINVAIHSIRFLFSICFRKELNKNLLPSIKLKKKMPTILSKHQFITIFNDENCLKHRCWLLLAFCSGLRVSEIATICIENIFPNEHKLKVLGKGNKERYTLLPDVTIKYLRLFCKEQSIHTKKGYLFKQSDNTPINNKSIINYFSTLKKAYNLDDNISFHSLRHSFATYYLMNGGNIITLKSMLGHTHLDTTSIYIHIAQNFNELEGVKYV